VLAVVGGLVTWRWFRIGLVFGDWFAMKDVNCGGHDHGFHSGVYALYSMPWPPQRSRVS
jgi:hypothetical protein